MQPYTHSALEKNIKGPDEVLKILMSVLPKPNSVVDFGCGLGAFLYCLQNRGVDNILGIDGDWVNEKDLIISNQFFFQHNLGSIINFKKKFDWAICLEVAEHLPPKDADILIENLTNHSDTIIFSAAPLMQGGQNHINEQPFDYWFRKFEAKGYYVLDIFRSLAWNISEIPWWYRQNLFIITCNTLLIEKYKNKVISSVDFYYYVHPNNFHNKMYKLNQLSKEYDFFLKGHAPLFFYLKIFFLRVKNLFKAVIKKV